MNAITKHLGILTGNMRRYMKIPPRSRLLALVALGVILFLNPILSAYPEASEGSRVASKTFNTSLNVVLKI
jgi:hypothetical protein